MATVWVSCQVVRLWINWAPVRSCRVVDGLGRLVVGGRDLGDQLGVVVEDLRGEELAVTGELLGQRRCVDLGPLGRDLVEGGDGALVLVLDRLRLAAMVALKSTMALSATARAVGAVCAFIVSR